MTGATLKSKKSQSERRGTSLRGWGVFNLQKLFRATKQWEEVKGLKRKGSIRNGGALELTEILGELQEKGLFSEPTKRRQARGAGLRQA